MNRGLIAVLLLLSLCAGSGFGQSSGKVRASGTEYFRFGLHLKSVSPVANPREALDHPQTSMIIAVGDLRNLAELVSTFELKNYLLAGGAVLIATDQATPLQNNWATIGNVTISGELLTAPQDKCYLGIPGRPFVRPRPGIGKHPSPFDLFDGVPIDGPEAIATDYPSELAYAVPPAVPPRDFIRISLASYAPATKRLRPGIGVPNEAYFAVSLQANFSPGRMIVLGDNHVFVNGMMGFEEAPETEKGFRTNNGNWAFTNRTIDWLQGGYEPKKRTHCLFIEDGQIVEKFAEELPRLPKPPIPNLPPEVIANIVLNNMNGIINEAQEKDFFNTMLERWIGFPRLIRWFLLVVTVVFLFTCFRLLLRGRRKAESSASISPQQRATLQPRGGILRQRTAAQIEVGNLFEAASRRVRDRFSVLGGQSGWIGTMPPILIAADVRDGPILQRTIEWLWQIGYGEAPMNVPPAEWDRLNELLERVMSRAARGDWSFGQDV